MSALVRKFKKIFGSNSPLNGVFGSAAALAPADSNDPEVIESLPAFIDGWSDATAGGVRLPTLEDLQGLKYDTDYHLAYIYQEGMQVYNSLTTYYTGSPVRKAGTTEIWKSLVDNNIGNALVAGANWSLVGNLSNLPASSALLSANNLSDVASASTARSNLGLAGVLSSIQTGANNTITVTSNAITVSNTISNYYISTSAPTTLNTINGGQQGQIIYLTIDGTAANYLLLANRANNIILSGNVNCFLNSQNADWVALRLDGTDWIEISRGGYNFNTSMLVQEQQSSGTQPAALVGGVTKVLNTAVYNSINGASLSSNQITLPPGTYRINANSPIYGANGGLQAYLYNTTTSTTTLLGTSTLSQSGTAATCQSLINGIFYNSAISVYELRAYLPSGVGGNQVGSGKNEVYSSVLLTRIG